MKEMMFEELKIGDVFRVTASPKNVYRKVAKAWEPPEDVCHKLRKNSYDINHGCVCEMSSGIEVERLSKTEVESLVK